MNKIKWYIPSYPIHPYCVCVKVNEVLYWLNGTKVVRCDHISSTITYRVIHYNSMLSLVKIYLTNLYVLLNFTT